MYFLPFKVENCHPEAKCNPWGWHGKREDDMMLSAMLWKSLMIYTLLPKESKGKHCDYSRESNSTPLFICLFFKKLKNMERHDESKLSFQEHTYTTESRGGNLFTAFTNIFYFSPSWQRLKLPELWTGFCTPLSIFSSKISGVFRNGFWTRPVPNSY